MTLVKFLTCSIVQHNSMQSSLGQNDLTRYGSPISSLSVLTETLS